MTIRSAASERTTAIMRLLVATAIFFGACESTGPDSSGEADVGATPDAPADVVADVLADLVEDLEPSLCPALSDEATARFSSCTADAEDPFPLGEEGFPPYEECHFVAEVPRAQLPTRSEPARLRLRTDLTELLNEEEQEMDVCRLADNETATFPTIDLDGDGATDIVGSRAVRVRAEDGTERCRLQYGVHWQNEDGSFTPFEQFSENIDRLQPLGTFNADHTPDYFVIWQDATASVLLGTGDRRLADGRRLSLRVSDGRSITTPTFADFDRDGHADLVAPRSGDTDLLYRNQDGTALVESSQAAGFVRHPEVSDGVPIGDHEPFFGRVKLENPWDATSPTLLSLLTDGGRSNNADYRCERIEDGLSCPLTMEAFRVPCDVRTDYLIHALFDLELSPANLRDLLGLIVNRTEGVDSLQQAAHAGHGPSTPGIGGASDPMDTLSFTFGGLACELYTQTDELGQSVACFDQEAYDRGDPGWVPVFTQNIVQRLSSGLHPTHGWGSQELVTGNGSPLFAIAYGRDSLADIVLSESERPCEVAQTINAELNLGQVIDCPEAAAEFGNGYIGFYEPVAEPGTGGVLAAAVVDIDFSLENVANFFGVNTFWIDYIDGRESEYIVVFETFYGFRYAAEVELDGNVARVRVTTEGEGATTWDCTGCNVTTRNPAGFQDGPRTMNMGGTSVNLGNYQGELAFAAQDSPTVEVLVEYPDGFAEVFAAVPANQRLQTLRRGEGLPGNGSFSTP